MSQLVNGEDQAVSRAARKNLKSKIWLQLVDVICLVYFVKLESSIVIVNLNRSVSVLGQRGVACSHTTMLAIPDHSLEGMICFFFLFSCFFLSL